MLREAGKEKTLLKALFRGESVVVADGPAVAADLLRENACRDNYQSQFRYR